jgi:hypothetical protein
MCRRFNHVTIMSDVRNSKAATNRASLVVAVVIVAVISRRARNSLMIRGIEIWTFLCSTVAVIRRTSVNLLRWHVCVMLVIIV